MLPSIVKNAAYVECNKVKHIEAKCVSMHTPVWYLPSPVPELVCVVSRPWVPSLTPSGITHSEDGSCQVVRTFGQPMERRVQALRPPVTMRVNLDADPTLMDKAAAVANSLIATS